jgi:hypothetical protein
MALRRKNAAQANGPHSAPHTPPAPPPAPSAAPPADGPAAAVGAALTAIPGATAAQIADSAGTSRAIAGRELAALEASGLATRTAGARKGRTTAPATWQPAPPPPAPVPAASVGPDQAPPASPADTATASPAPAAGDGDLPAPDGEPDEPGGGSAPDADAAVNAPADDSGAGETAPASADSDTPGEAAEDGAPGAGAPDGGSAADSASGGETAAPADGEPQPAATGEAAVLLRELASAATGAGEALDGGDTAAAMAVIDAICAGAAQSRRLVKAAATGRKPRGTGTSARPGQLRDLVAAHLAANPVAEFSPHAIGRVLGRSSGAVANALDRLTALGQAQLTSDKPRRYQHKAATAPAAPGGAT